MKQSALRFYQHRYCQNLTSTSNLVFFEKNVLLYNVVYNMRIKAMHKCVYSIACTSISSPKLLDEYGQNFVLKVGLQIEFTWNSCRPLTIMSKLVHLKKLIIPLNYYVKIDKVCLKRFFLSFFSCLFSYSDLILPTL
jgi:hypothetical protein